MPYQGDGYQSLHTVADNRPGLTRTGTSKRSQRAQPQEQQQEQPRTRIGKMVRMASDLFTVHQLPPASRQSSTYGTMNNQGESALAEDEDEDGEWIEEEIWGNWRLILLTIGLAGAQLAWTIELGYGTPYLLSLGLSKELTSLVWLAGPISGFVVHPVIGALSDNSSSKYRRRRWVVYGTVFITVATFTLAFAGELATRLVDLFNRGQGDWDPQRDADIRLTRIGLAVAAFYILDFSLNATQAALRALVLDMVPSDQQTGANGYVARMTNIGNIVGYGVGYINLNSSVLLRWIGGGQFRKLCIVAIITLLLTVIITCATNHEERLPKRKRNKSLKATFMNIFNAAKDLPIPIRRVCYVQLFSWSGFFPVMFYSTTWIAIRYYLEDPENPPDNDTATRAGSLALLFQSIVAVATSLAFPAFQAAGASEYVLSRPPGKAWNLIRWSLTWWTPRNIWTASHVFFVVVMSMTFFVRTRQEATAVVALLGISWAITCWVPYAILMEFIREMEAGAELNADEVISASEIYDEIEGSRLTVPGANGRTRRSSRSSQRSRRSRRSSKASSVQSGRSGRLRAGKALTECRPLMAVDEEGQQAEEAPKEVGGTILGIHNLAIVSPQFFTAIVASIIFKISEITSDSPFRKRHGIESGADVVWVLRFGGFMTIFAIIVSRWVPAPPSEQYYVSALAEASNVLPDEDEQR